MPGHYIGIPHVTFLPDGRNMKLTEEFGFISAKDVPWRTPAGMETDGASIPSFLWTILGPPFGGRYRDAAIVHDWYCSVRSRSWQDTHLMFHEAMLVSDVGPQKARLLYFGVRFGGPRWSEMDSINIEKLVGKSPYTGVNPLGGTRDNSTPRNGTVDSLIDNDSIPARPNIIRNQLDSLTEEEKYARFIALVGGDLGNPQLPVSLDRINQTADEAREV